MDEERLLRLLARLNPWWDGGDVPETLLMGQYRRRDFHALKSDIDNEPVTTICGPRQVGKTTLVGQLVDHLLNERGVDPRRVLYLTTETSQLLPESGEVVADLLEAYERHFLEKSFDKLDETAYVFVDEIQKVDDWDETLKFYVDTVSNLSFVVTGSVSALIQRDASDTLVGRTEQRTVVPFKFADYVDYHSDLDSPQATGLRASLKDALTTGDRESFESELKRSFAFRSEDEPELRSLLNDYLTNGGYPGVLDKDPAAALYKLDQDLQRVVTGDIESTYSVKKPNAVFGVLRYFAESTGSKINVDRISKETETARSTVERYVSHLEEFFLVYRCQHYTGSAKPGRKQPMAYVNDVGHLNTLLGVTPDTPTAAEDRGVQLETMVCDHLRRLQHYLSGRRNTTVEYCETTGEVDFVVSGHDYVLPVEVKWGDSTDANLGSVRQFVQRKNAEFGLAVNNAGALAVDDRVVHVPAWLFLSLC
ncbi:ATP-binding protein [Halobaculum sp. MBLA0143]|uniref:ATP-binding protein n=1 Tax=Halobaculum sp. MBLA0143 TaxID=3079933 RepID=UPI003523B817